MASYNKVILIGRLTQDPELKTTQNGISVVSGAVAVDRSYKQGEERKTDFVNFVAWRKTAEFIAKFFDKGAAILIEGELQTRSYTANDGGKRYVTEVVVSNAAFVESKSAQQQAQAPGTAAGNAYPASVPDEQMHIPSDAEWQTVGDEDELPF